MCQASVGKRSLKHSDDPLPRPYADSDVMILHKRASPKDIWPSACLATPARVIDAGGAGGRQKNTRVCRHAHACLYSFKHKSELVWVFDGVGSGSRTRTHTTSPHTCTFKPAARESGYRQVREKFTQETATLTYAPGEGRGPGVLPPRTQPDWPRPVSAPRVSSPRPPGLRRAKAEEQNLLPGRRDARNERRMKNECMRQWPGINSSPAQLPLPPHPFLRGSVCLGPESPGRHLSKLSPAGGLFVVRQQSVDNAAGAAGLHMRHHCTAPFLPLTSSSRALTEK